MEKDKELLKLCLDEMRHFRHRHRDNKELAEDLNEMERIIRIVQHRFKNEPLKFLRMDELKTLEDWEREIESKNPEEQA